MTLDIEAVKKLAAKSYINDVKDVFGEDGTDTLTKLLDGVREFFKHLPPDQSNGKIIFFSTVPSVMSDQLSLLGEFGEVQSYTSEMSYHLP